MMAMNLLMPPRQQNQQVNINAPIVQNVNPNNNPQNKPENTPPENTPNDEIIRDNVRDDVRDDANNPNTPPIQETPAKPEWITLGSMKPKSNYKMLVTLTNQGAAVVRAELNTERYKGVQEQSGYLGQLVADQNASDFESLKLGGGVIVQTLGNGTPAQIYGLKIGDRITQFTNLTTQKSTDIKKFLDLRNALLQSNPKDKISLQFVRESNKIEQEIILDQPPLDVIRPESAPHNYDNYSKLGGLRGVVFNGGNNKNNDNGNNNDNDDSSSDQLSFLTTLLQLDENKLDLPKSLNANNSSIAGFCKRDNSLDKEILDLKLRRKTWKVINKSENEVTFATTIPKYNIEILKTFYLAQNDEKTTLPNVAGTGYHLKLKLEIKNLDSKSHKIAYQLDGPTGLPLEGGWYAQKTGPTWSRFGIRDIVVKFQGNNGQVIPNNLTAMDKITDAWGNTPIEYIGVDSLYFQCTIKPNKPVNENTWHEYSMPIRVGERNYNWQTLTNVSFRLWGSEKSLNAGEKLEHEYFIFLGPKNTKLLDDYGLSQTVSYGWFWFVAQPLLWMLQTFNRLGVSYAVAIILLTILVRILIFPLSRKMAIGAIKMAELQPQIQAINEKHKDDMQARSKAINALFKEHNYNPMAGCLPLVIQLPIFIGLYKALSIDPGLYGTPLITKSFRWCSDLSAPDRLVEWSNFWNWIGYSGFNEGQGIFTLGPFFNLLPLLTIALFLIQQEIMMPPPAPNDEQAKMQRRMMKFMMIFMGLLFFKVPSGLCIYFIASTIFALFERRFIPKAKPKENNKTSEMSEEKTPSTIQSTPTQAIADSRSKKNKNKRKNPAEDKKTEKSQNFIVKWIRELIEKANDEKKFEEGRKKKDKDKKKK
jgi:YidC/Oxa1 family membrane protein insertase